MWSVLKDLTGKRFGKLVVIKRIENKIISSGREFTQWECQCDCGNITTATSNSLQQGSKKSCDCLIGESSKRTDNKYKKHGMTNTRLFTIWGGMKERCYNPNHLYYKNYGGRGIEICNEWLNDDGFINFYNWAINNGYDDKLTINRINNDLGYYPENCAWSTNKEQQNNMSSNVIIEYNGESKTLAQWCDIYCKTNKDRNRAYTRNRNGVSFEHLFDPPDESKIRY